MICSQCGGELALPTGQRVVDCRFCDSALFVDRSGVVSHYRVPPLLDEPEARAALRRWMAGNDTVKGLDREAAIESLEMVSFPVWLFRAAGADGERVLVEPAAPTPIPQVADLRVPAGRLEPFREDAATMRVIEVTVPQETARGWLEQRGPIQIHETALIRFPLWRCFYRYRGRSYLAAVDGSTGAVMAADYPQKSESPYLLTATLGLVLFGLEGLLISDLGLKLVAYALTAAPLTLLAYWVARKV